MVGQGLSRHRPYDGGDFLALPWKEGACGRGQCHWDGKAGQLLARLSPLAQAV